MGGSCVAFDEARRGGIYTQGCRDAVCVSLGNGLTLLNVNPTLLLSRCRVHVLCPLHLPRDAVYVLPYPLAVRSIFAAYYPRSPLDRRLSPRKSFCRRTPVPAA